MATKINAYFERFKQGYLVHSVPFVFILCGIAGMLVDIDHIPKLLYMLIGGHIRVNGRPFHPLFFLIALCVCIYIGAKLFGEFIKYSARKEGQTILEKQHQ